MAKKLLQKLLRVALSCPGVQRAEVCPLVAQSEEQHQKVESFRSSSPNIIR